MQEWGCKPSTLVARLRRKWKETYPEMRLYRELVHSRREWERRFLKADYASAELHTMGVAVHDVLEKISLRQASKSPCFNPDGTWRESVSAPLDPHLIVAAQLMGISYDEAQKRFAAGDAAVRSKRNYAKHYIHFGNPTGMR